MAGAVEGDRNRLEPRPAPFQKGDGWANFARTVKRTGFSAPGDNLVSRASSPSCTTRNLLTTVLGFACSGSHRFLRIPGLELKNHAGNSAHSKASKIRIQKKLLEVRTLRSRSLDALPKPALLNCSAGIDRSSPVAAVLAVHGSEAKHLVAPLRYQTPRERCVNSASRPRADPESRLRSPLRRRSQWWRSRR